MIEEKSEEKKERARRKVSKLKKREKCVQNFQQKKMNAPAPYSNPNNFRDHL